MSTLPCASGAKKILGWIFVISAVLVILATTVHADTISFFSVFPQLDLKRWTISSGWANGPYQSCEWRSEAISLSGNDLQLTLSDKGGRIRPIGCAEIHTNETTGYGWYEARLRTAEGSGLNTAFFTYIGPPTGGPKHDEIDFEFLGKNPHTVQLNYYTNGKPKDGSIINLGYDASKEFHNYSFDWKPGKIIWYVDGRPVHETSTGAQVPDTAGRIYLSLWSGSSAEDAWLGHFSYTAPVTAYVSWVKFSSSQQ